MKTFITIVTLSVLIALSNADSNFSDNPNADMRFSEPMDRELQALLAPEEIQCYDALRVVKILATECERDENIGGAGAYSLTVLFDQDLSPCFYTSSRYTPRGETDTGTRLGNVLTDYYMEHETHFISKPLPATAFSTTLITTGSGKEIIMPYKGGAAGTAPYGAATTAAYTLYQMNWGPSGPTTTTSDIWPEAFGSNPLYSGGGTPPLPYVCTPPTGAPPDDCKWTASVWPVANQELADYIPPLSVQTTARGGGAPNTWGDDPWSWSECQAATRTVDIIDCTDCDCCGQQQTVVSTTTSPYNCKYQWNEAKKLQLAPWFAPSAQPNYCCQCQNECEAETFEKQTFHLVSVYNFAYPDSNRDAVTLSRWFETKLVIQTYLDVSGELQGDIDAVEIPALPCDCVIIIKHSIIIEYIEEREMCLTSGGGATSCTKASSTTNGQFPAAGTCPLSQTAHSPCGAPSGCATPMDPACLLDWWTGSPYDNDVPTSPPTNHPRYPPPGPTPFTRRLSHLVDWDVPRRKGPFATLTTVLLRIRVSGNSDRAIDLKELWLDHKPTGGGPQQSTLILDSTHGAAHSNFDNVLHWWDGNIGAASTIPGRPMVTSTLSPADTTYNMGLRQFNIVIRYLGVGDSDMTWRANVQLCAAGTANIGSFTPGGENCPSRRRQLVSEVREEKSAKILRRRVLQDNADGEKESLYQMEAAKESFCDFEKDESCRQKATDAYNSGSDYDASLESSLTGEESGETEKPPSNVGLIAVVFVVIILSVGIGITIGLKSKPSGGQGSNSQSGQHQSQPVPQQVPDDHV